VSFSVDEKRSKSILKQSEKTIRRESDIGNWDHDQEGMSRYALKPKMVQKRVE
jgi:hypothetical protein